jgi:hypothetical protein
MVLGLGIAVTAVALMYQCALTTRMARGRGTASPKDFHAEVYRFTSTAFIGFPCPKNAAGIRFLASLVAAAVTIEAFLRIVDLANVLAGWPGVVRLMPGQYPRCAMPTA